MWRTLIRQGYEWIGSGYRRWWLSLRRNSSSPSLIIPSSPRATSSIAWGSSRSRRASSRRRAFCWRSSLIDASSRWPSWRAASESRSPRSPIRAFAINRLPTTKNKRRKKRWTRGDGYSSSGRLLAPRLTAGVDMYKQVVSAGVGLMIRIYTVPLCYGAKRPRWSTP